MLGDDRASVSKWLEDGVFLPLYQFFIARKEAPVFRPITLMEEVETPYAHRFGSLIRAYELIGFTPDRDYSYIETNRELRKMYPQVVEDVIRRIRDIGGTVHREVRNDFLIVNNEVKVSVVICRCQSTPSGANRWKIHLDTGLLPDITIAIRMDYTNTQAMDYYLLPALDVESPKIRLAENNHFALDAYRFETLEPFFLMTEREMLEAA